MEAPRPIFQDENGNALKFFIQKDLPDDVQQRLQEDIKASRLVHAKVPIAGYILTAPGTPEEQRLRYCWRQPDRPERFFVPYTFVDACKTARKLIPQLFIEQGEPMQFHLHPSILNVNMRQVIAERIRHSGGIPDAPLETARVILADPGDDAFKELVKQYEGDPQKYIEAFFWVQKCVEMGAIYFSPTAYKNPGGRRPGEERTNFTEEDERHICEWLAFKIPYKEAGGRTGNKVYQQLVALAEHDAQYEWVKRHTWQSWRERYKKHAHRLDRVIDSIVEHKKPMLGEKGQYGYVRVDVPEEPTPRPKTKRKRKQKETPEPTDDDGAYGGPVMLSSPNRETDTHSALPAPGPPRSQPAAIPPPPSQPPRRSARRAASQPPKAAQTVDELDSESQWAIRIGDAPPPTWARPRDEDDDALAREQSPTKRARIRENTPPAQRAPERVSPVYVGGRQSSRDAQTPVSANQTSIEEGEIQSQLLLMEDRPASSDEGRAPIDGSQVLFDESQRSADETQATFDDSQPSLQGTLFSVNTQTFLSDSQPLTYGGHSFDHSAAPSAKEILAPVPPTQSPAPGSQASVGETPPVASESQSQTIESQPATDDSQPEPTTGDSQDSAVILSRIHATERALRDIARSFRFTYEEVREYHDKCGDTARVRMRFQEMRAVLKERFPDM
ncbi:hypothetical protein HDZ31DRAFT_84797 [Schizophyllum fasciatum]